MLNYYRASIPKANSHLNNFHKGSRINNVIRDTKTDPKFRRIEESSSENHFADDKMLLSLLNNVLDFSIVDALQRHGFWYHIHKRLKSQQNFNTYKMKN